MGLGSSSDACDELEEEDDDDDEEEKKEGKMEEEGELDDRLEEEEEEDDEKEGTMEEEEERYEDEEEEELDDRLEEADEKLDGIIDGETEQGESRELSDNFPGFNMCALEDGLDEKLDEEDNDGDAATFFVEVGTKSFDGIRSPCDVRCDAAFITLRIIEVNSRPRGFIDSCVELPVHISKIGDALKSFTPGPCCCVVRTSFTVDIDSSDLAFV
jgi:hypothetical protein